MPAQPLRSLLAFDRFVLDLTRGVLTAEAREVVLRPKTTAVLAHLLAHAGHVVSRDAIITAVWGDLAVTDDSLTQCVSEIRRALGADGARVLQTHARRGYMMATRLRPVAPPPPDPADMPTPVVAPPAPARPSSAEPIPAGKPPRSRMSWAALAIGCGAVALSAAAWMRAEHAPAPAVLASAAPSSGDRAWVLVEEGRAAQRGEGSREARLRGSLPFFLRALAIEPRLAEAAAEAAFVHVNLRNNGVSRDPEQDLREAERLAALAMAAAPEAPSSLGARAAVLRQQRRFAEALVFYERAAQDPGRVTDRANVGITHVWLGDPDAALTWLQTALHEEPRGQASGGWRSYLGLAHLLAGQPDQAAEIFLTSGSILPFPPEDLSLYRLAALHAAGRLAEADALSAELRQWRPAQRTQPLRALGFSEEPRYRALFERAVLEPLRRMGWFQTDP